MSFQKLIELAKELTQQIEYCELAEIEQDLLKDELKKGYMLLCNAAPETAPQSEVVAPTPVESVVEEEVVAPEPTVEEPVAEEKEEIVEQEIVTETKEAEMPEPEVVVEKETDTKEAVAEEEIIEIKQDASVEKEAPEAFSSLYDSGALFDIIDQIPAKGTTSTVLGDVLGEKSQTVADMLASNQTSGTATLNTTISASLGLNDKFLIVQELFGGDSEAFERAMATFDTFETLDQALIYIYDNFQWSSEGNGAKLLMDILTKKLK